MKFHQNLIILLAMLSAPLWGAPVESGDPFLWLEEKNGAKALEWVKNENAKTVNVLESDPNFKLFYEQALAIRESKGWVSIPQRIGGEIYNFTQDANHIHGIWRHVPQQGYKEDSPNWVTALDIDALAKTENINWVWKEANCASPSQKTCLISLSDGGEDAITVREFDRKQGHFDPSGFTLPKGKQSVAWEDQDSLLVAREWAPGDLTSSGYPFIVKRVKRGSDLASSTEVFRGSSKDIGVWTFSMRDGSGHHALFIDRLLSMFDSEFYLVTANGAEKLSLPSKSNIIALVEGRLVISLNEDWKLSDRIFYQGSVISLDLAATRGDPLHLRPVLIYRPGPKESFQEARATKDRLVITILDNVRGRALVYQPKFGDGWTKSSIPLPENMSISIIDTSEQDNNVFLGVTGFLTPWSLWSADLEQESVNKVKSVPALFDATNMLVDQEEAVSKDGTKIPYFLVHTAAMKWNGNNPTIISAYGGFQLAMTPVYSPVVGKLWLEKGGVFVLANIRGGGEFGPAWHDAWLKTKRQSIFDDFAAVAQDLIAKKVTEPCHLGIKGESAGGLLMGVEMTQHPELWNAVDIGIPLLDMLRFEQIEAGASWISEYGSVSNPEEKDFLASISPYHQLHAGHLYPEPFIWTATTDDRVGPQHARKFAAKLGLLGYPYFFYELMGGGHGEGATPKEQAHNEALEWTYFSRNLY